MNRNRIWCNWLLGGLFLLILILSTITSQLAVGWGSDPNVYLYFGATTIFFLFCTFCNYRVTSLAISKIDATIIIIGAYIFIRQSINGFSGLQSDYFLSLLTAFAIYIGFLLTLRNNLLHTISFFVIGLSLIASLQSIWALVQVLHNGLKTVPKGSFDNPNILASFLIASLPFVYYIRHLNLSRNKLFQIIFSTAFSIVIVAVVLLTRSRGAIVSLFVLSVIFIMNRGMLKKMGTKNLILILLFLLSLCAYLGYLLISKSNSLQGRILIWENTVRMISKRPLFGYGIGGFEKNYMLFQAEYFNLHPNSKFLLIADDVLFSFNIVLQVFVETGLVGALLLSIILAYITRSFKRHTSSINKSAFSSLGIAIVNGLFSYNLQCTSCLIITILSIGIISNSDPVLTYRLRFHKPVFLIVGVLFSVYLLFQYMGHKFWRQAQDFVIYDERKAIEFYEKAYPYLNHRGMFLKDCGEALLETGHSKQSLDILLGAQNFLNITQLSMSIAKCNKKLGYLDAAIIQNTLAVNMNPKLFQPRFYLIQLYLLTNHQSDAINEAKKIIVLPEKIKSDETQKIKAFANRIAKNK